MKEELYKQQIERTVFKLSPTDIYDFAAWLTTREGVMEVGSSCLVTPMANAVEEYIRTFPERFTDDSV